MFQKTPKILKWILPLFLGVLVLVAGLAVTVHFYPEAILHAVHFLRTCEREIKWQYPDSEFTDNRAFEVSRHCLDICGEDNSKLTPVPRERGDSFISRNVTNYDWASLIWRSSNSPPHKTWTLSTNLYKSEKQVQCVVGYPF